ncbi:MAG: hypothetical protein NC928_04030 [Candidatus Omnitrophica bacterium]|nr:hypothetical protein [Candidatus Omnitrophota bacterium]
MNIYPPDDLILCDFEKKLDFLKWRCINSFLEPSDKHPFCAVNSARVVYYPTTGISALLTEDYNLGLLQVKDWSFFRFFKFEIFNGENLSSPLHIKIKDSAGRTVERKVILQKGNNKIVFNLEDIGQDIDLANVIYLNLFFINPDKEITLYIDNFRLERGGLKEKRVLDKETLNLVKVICPRQAKRGEEITLSAFLSVNMPLKKDYRVFIHFSSIEEIKKKPEQRRWYINADHQPWIETSKWQVNVHYEIGPLNIYIPKSFPVGEYVLQIGLYNPNSYGSYYSYSSNRGMMDFRRGFPRLRYVNPELDNYIVAKIRVLN